MIHNDYHDWLCIKKKYCFFTHRWSIKSYDKILDIKTVGSGRGPLRISLGNLLISLNDTYNCIIFCVKKIQ